jgi:hypothetical protein
VSALPDTVSALPDTLSALPDTVSALPDTVSALPDTVSALPDTVSALPDTVLALPDTVSALPDTVSALPDTTHHLELIFDSINQYKSCNNILLSLILTKMHSITQTEHFSSPSPATYPVLNIKAPPHPLNLLKHVL